MSTGNSAITNLLPFTEYEFRVRALNPGGDSDWTAVMTVTTEKSVQPAPTLNVFATGSRTISVEWSPVQYASGYIVQYAASEAFTSGVNVITINSPSTTSTIIDNLSPGTTYYIRVKPTGEVQSVPEFSDVKSATTELIKLSTPTLGDLVITGGNAISVTWSTVANADSYVLEYATNFSFTNPQRLEMENTSTTLTDLIANTLYYVRVIAIGTEIYIDSDWSAVKSVTTERIKLDIPAFNIEDTIGNTISIAWEQIPHASGYVIQYSTDDEFEADVVTLPAVLASQNSATIRGRKIDD